MLVKSDSDLISEAQLRNAIEIVGAQALLEHATISIHTLPNSWAASVLLVQPLQMAFFLVGNSEALLVDWPQTKSVVGSSPYSIRFRDCFDSFIWLLAHECRHIDQFFNPNLRLTGAGPEEDADDWAYEKVAEWQRCGEAVRPNAVNRD